MEWNTFIIDAIRRNRLNLPNLPTTRIVFSVFILKNTTQNFVHFFPTKFLPLFISLKSPRIFIVRMILKRNAFVFLASRLFHSRHSFTHLASKFIDSVSMLRLVITRHKFAQVGGIEEQEDRFLTLPAVGKFH